MLHLQFTPFPTLATERLLLRSLEAADDPAIFRLRSDEGIRKYILTTPRAVSIDDATAWREKVMAQIERNEVILWVITSKEDGGFAGCISLWKIVPETDTAELGYTMMPEYEGKGIMQEAATAVLDYGFTTMKLKLVEAYTHRDNYKSRRLLERNGFGRDAELEKRKIGITEPETSVIYTLQLNRVQS